MNQNVFGVILFSLIVGTAVFVSVYFVPLPVPPAVVEKTFNTITVDKKYSCSKQSRRTVYQPPQYGLANVKVIQAVFNQETKQLNTEFRIKRLSNETEGVRIALHFFVKNGKNTTYQATETITLRPDFANTGTADHAVVSSFKWLNDMQPQDNLYVIAESTVSFNQSKSLEPVFEAAKAQSVTVMNK